MGPWKPGKSWNLKILIPGFERPGIWTYRSIFLIISIAEFSCCTSFEMTSLTTTTDWTLLTYSVCVISMSVNCNTAFIENMCILLHVKSSWIHWKDPGILHWNVLENSGILYIKMCMNPLVVSRTTWLENLLVLRGIW